MKYLHLERCMFSLYLAASMLLLTHSFLFIVGLVWISLANNFVFWLSIYFCAISFLILKHLSWLRDSERLMSINLQFCFYLGEAWVWSFSVLTIFLNRILLLRLISKFAKELSFLTKDREQEGDREWLDWDLDWSATTLFALMRLMRCLFWASAFSKMASLSLLYFKFQMFMFLYSLPSKYSINIT